MKTMESSSLSHKTLFDPIRKKQVEKTPEECVRQFIIRTMVDKLGYPPALIAIEKELSALSQEKHTVPKRRVDILVYAKLNGCLVPVLMVECKAVPLNPKCAQQVIGYNAFVGALYVALANGQQILTGCFDIEEGAYRFTEGLPTYQDLQRALN